MRESVCVLETESVRVCETDRVCERERVCVCETEKGRERDQHAVFL